MYLLSENLTYNNIILNKLDKLGEGDT